MLQTAMMTPELIAYIIQPNFEPEEQRVTPKLKEKQWTRSQVIKLSDQMAVAEVMSNFLELSNRLFPI